MLPVTIQEKTFRDWQRQINTFNWKGKKPRIRFNVLQDKRKRGGLAVPNLKLYYQAAGLVWLIDWIINPN